MAGWYRKEINSVADLKGLKMRVAGLAGQGSGHALELIVKGAPPPCIR